MPGRPWQVRQTTLEVNLALLKKNFTSLQKRARGADLLVLLKSDAYGHSHQGVSKFLDSLSGLHGFGVANVEEGIELRREGVQSPIYVMSGIQHFDNDLLRCLHTCNLIPVISSLSVLKETSDVLEAEKAELHIHLKFNTGMNRLGIDQHEIGQAIEILKKNSRINLQGLMSHLAIGENAKSPLTKKQIKNFRDCVNIFKKNNFKPKYLHLENSAGLANHCYKEGNLARVGLHLYGLGDKTLNPIAKWTAQIYQIRELNKGDCVGYGARFKAKKKMKLAILGVGYGDGYKRAFSNKAEVLVRGKRCKVIGSVSMDLTAIDISKVPDACTNDRAVLLGADGKDEISATELAKHAQTIPWEIVTSISPRVPRVFIHGTN